ncbi:MAG: hypothetical protein J5789_05315, partial [Oscillospiraceae bacterium]|nr:hypothetical protein [Oscillospiraceae bacterium]
MSIACPNELRLAAHELSCGHELPCEASSRIDFTTVCVFRFSPAGQGRGSKPLRGCVSRKSFSQTPHSNDDFIRDNSKTSTISVTAGGSRFGS